MDTTNNLTISEETTTFVQENESDLLKILVENSKKELLFAKVRTLICAGMLLVLCICAICIVPKMLLLTAEANGLMNQASEVMTNANTAITEITEMSESISTMSDKMDSLLSDNAETLSSTMQKLNAIDFEGLNHAITDLGNVVEPLAKFFSFGRSR